MLSKLALFIFATIFTVTAGSSDPAPAELQPVRMTGVAKSTFFLLRSLAENEGDEIPVGARILTDEPAFEKFRKELETKFGVAFQRQSYERPESVQSSRPYQYEDDTGTLRTLRLRVLADKGGGKIARRLLEFRADDNLADQAVAKFRLRLPEELVSVIFKRDEFLPRKKEIQRLVEKDSANEDVPVREMLNLIEALHLSAKKGPPLVPVGIGYQRTRYRLELPLAGSKLKAVAEIIVDQAIRFTDAKGEVLHDAGKAGRLVELRLPPELVKQGAAEVAKAPALAKLRESLARLEASRSGEASYRAFLETKKDSPVIRTAISPEN